MTSRRPECECHDSPMTLRNDTSTGWRCTVANNEAQWRWRNSKRGRLTEHRYESKRYLEHLDARVERNTALYDGLIVEFNDIMAGLGVSPEAFDL